MENINAEVVSTFKRNGNTYIILELNEGIDKTKPWPDPKDVKIKVIIENNKLVLIAYYKDEEKFRKEYDLTPELCGNHDDLDLFSVKILGVEFTVYLRYLWICAHLDVPDKYFDYSFQVWARSGDAKTRLIDTTKGTVDIPD